MKTKENNEIRNLVNRVRFLMAEADEHDSGHEDGDGVPYTDQDELFSSIKDTAKAQFGADFSKIENPMIYYPQDGGDVTLSGNLPTLSDATFMYKYKNDSGGCYIWVNELKLNEDTLNTLNVMFGVYKNWKDELARAEDIKPMSLKNQTQDENVNPNMVPGDDF